MFAVLNHLPCLTNVSIRRYLFYLVFSLVPGLHCRQIRTCLEKDYGYYWMSWTIRHKTLWHWQWRKWQVFSIDEALSSPYFAFHSIKLTARWLGTATKVLIDKLFVNWFNYYAYLLWWGDIRWNDRNAYLDVNIIRKVCIRLIFDYYTYSSTDTWNYKQPTIYTQITIK